MYHSPFFSSSSMASVASSEDSLPPELFYEITADLLTEYLHLSILQPEGVELWNAFTVLPLVSHVFRSLTSSFFLKMFGEVGSEAIKYVFVLWSEKC